MYGWGLAGWLVAGCFDGPSEQTVEVFAAASLSDAFADLERSFEAEHAGSDVRRSHAGSQVLRLQIEQGAPAHVFASANPEHLERLVEQGLASEVVRFARSPLVVIVPEDSPITDFAALLQAERIVVGSPAVPIGAYTAQMLEGAGPAFAEAFAARVVSRESSVRQVRAKVVLGEADAAVVYAADANLAGIRVIPLPERLQTQAEFVIGTTGPNVLAAAFVAHVQSRPDVLRSHGLTPAGSK